MVKYRKKAIPQLSPMKMKLETILIATMAILKMRKPLCSNLSLFFLLSEGSYSIIIILFTNPSENT